jgi:S-formylglutathione hydrolase FrmB
MDEMISSGQIDPMIVVTPNATNNLGGGFYTNSPVMSNGRYYGGRMQDFVADEVVHIIDSVYNTIPNRAHRGISGHSMGGYGAVRLALQRNELFGSVSSMSAPLAFAGQGTSDTALFNGLWELMPMVYFENGFTPGNVSAFYNITPAPSKRLTSMMFAMAAAFSPRDPTDPDTNYAHRFSTRGFAGYIKLPFDVNGQLVSSIWDSLWMANDVTAMLLMQPGLLGVFDSTALYVDAGAEDDLGLNYHAQVFAGVAGAAVDQFEIYPGIGGGLYPADHFALISERLKKVAKFHDNAFGQ